MNVLLVNTADTLGGASRGAYRLHLGLRRIGIESRMLVKFRLGSDPHVLAVEQGIGGKLMSKAVSLADRWPLRAYPRRDTSETWNVQRAGLDILPHVRRLHPDIVHLNWIGEFVSVSAIGRLPAPVVWTLSDMWAMTGGCHYDRACGRYAESCGRCPTLGSDHDHDLSRRTCARKRSAWQRQGLTIVCISQWLADCARASSLLGRCRVERIPYGLDLERFRPLDRGFARQALRLPADRRLVLFGADGGTRAPRKGFGLLEEAMARLAARDGARAAELVVFGEQQSPGAIRPYRTHWLGRVQDDATLALAYSAADVLAAPSIQEAFGLVAAEAMACGTPVLAFRSTGLSDIVDHQENGWLADLGSVQDLVAGLDWVLADDDRLTRLSCEARRKAEREFGLELQAHRYQAIYEDLLRQKRSARMPEGESGA